LGVRCCATIDAALQAVEAGDAELAMIPMENSRAGRVADIHHVLPESSLHIVQEHYQPIHHNLLALPGVNIRELESVQSHVQALSQSRATLRELELKPVGWSDTASAAMDVSTRGVRSRAAIASTLAAEVYGLTVLREHIEDCPNNTTRFVVMARGSHDPGRTEACITAAIFEVRNVPAALFKALGGFATNNVNLTKLESYQQGESFLLTHFYIEFEGHPSDPPVARALDEMRYFCCEGRVVGTFAAHPFRARSGG